MEVKMKAKRIVVEALPSRSNRNRIKDKKRDAQSTDFRSEGWGSREDQIETHTKGREQ